MAHLARRLSHLGIKYLNKRQRLLPLHHFSVQNSQKVKRIRPLHLGVLTGIALISYDGIAQDFAYCGSVQRFFIAIKTASSIAFDYLLLQGNENDVEYEKKLKEIHQKSANRLLLACLKNGGLYIKVGQGFAAINHILPKEYTDTLSQLQDKCLTTTQKDVDKVFIHDFGRSPKELYAEFDYKPVAAASLAQVFKAKLKTGEDVAVKVQYSDLQNRFTSDLATIIFIQDIIELFFKSYNFGWILRDVYKNLLSELDFIHEGQNSERCARDLQKFNFVHIPKVYWELTQKRVLTLEWMDGFKISDVNAIERNKLSLRDIDQKLFKIFAEQIFNSGFVHADPHPGNILVRKNEKTNLAEIILLDHGLYEEIPEQVKLTLCEFWEASVMRDEYKMQTSAKKLEINDHIKFAEVLFQQPMRIHGGQIKTKLTEKDIQYMQEVAKKNFELIMDTLKEMPRNMLFVVRNLNTIRAIGRQHGDVVDRPRLMARHAQRCFYAYHSNVSNYIYWSYRRFLFEFKLWSTSIRMSLLNFYFNVLYILGRAPKSATSVLREISEPQIE